MMLDAKQTFDQLIARHAEDEEARERVLDNAIYQQISSALAGSQEYMAMEKLFELHSEGRFDLLVLDVPTASECVAAAGQALVALEVKVEQLCASSPVGDYLITMQLQAVRRERLAVDAAARQKELVSQKLTAQ